MAIKDCIDEIRKIVGDKLSAEDVETIAKTVAANAKKARAQNQLLSEREALDAAAEQYAGEKDAAAKIERRNRAINLATRRARQDFYASAKANEVTPYESVQALNVGINKKMPGSKLSVDARGKALGRSYLGGLIGDLQRSGVLEYLTRRNGLFGDREGPLDADVATALYSIGKDGKVTSESTPEVKTIAETIWKWQEVARQRMNRAGTWIKQMPGYIVQQSHDAALMVKAGYDKWAATIKPLLDPKTFGDADPDEFLKSAYAALTSGLHFTPRGELPKTTGFRGYANLAERHSHERVLFFRDGASWNTYNNAFGTRSLAEAVFGGLSRSARDTALMETWGTNPESAFRDDVASLGRANRDNPEALRELLGRKKHFLESLDNQWKEITGESRIAQNVRAASIAAGIRNGHTITKLGSAILSHLTILPTAASELRWQGVPLGQRYSSFLSEFLGGLGSKEAKEAAYDIGIGFEGLTDGIAARFSSPDASPGVLSGLVRATLKLNAMSWTIENAQSAFGRAMAARVAREATKGWSAIDPRLSSALERYGFDENSWEALRRAPKALDDGRRYLTPDMVAALPDSAFSGMGAKTARQAQAQRDRLTGSLSTFYSDRIDTAIPTPGARERAILDQGLQPGTWMGEAARLIAQFKQYPTTLLTRVVGRELDGQGFRALLQGKGDIVGLAALAAQMTVAGFIAMEGKQLVTGKTPRDPFGTNWPNVWSAAMAQSGAMGLYGDFLFGEYDRFGQSPLTAFAGPTASTTSDAVALLSGLFHTQQNREGDLSPKTSMGDVLRFGASNTPFLNLFYTRAAFDYLILYHLQEMASPGYLRRSERNLKRTTGQSYIVPPSSVVPYGGAY